VRIGVEILETALRTEKSSRPCRPAAFEGALGGLLLRRSLIGEAEIDPLRIGHGIRWRIYDFRVFARLGKRRNISR
jgi:hypothetical protein